MFQTIVDVTWDIMPIMYIDGAATWGAYFVWSDHVATDFSPTLSLLPANAHTRTTLAKGIPRSRTEPPCTQETCKRGTRVPLTSAKNKTSTALGRPLDWGPPQIWFRSQISWIAWVDIEQVVQERQENKKEGVRRKSRVRGVFTAV